MGPSGRSSDSARTASGWAVKEGTVFSAYRAFQRSRSGWPLGTGLAPAPSGDMNVDLTVWTQTLGP